MNPKSTELTKQKPVSNFVRWFTCTCMHLIITVEFVCYFDKCWSWAFCFQNQSVTMVTDPMSQAPNGQTNKKFMNYAP